MADKKRKEVELSPLVIKGLEKLAKADGRKLKPYMEKILREHAINETLDNIRATANAMGKLSGKSKKS